MVKILLFEILYCFAVTGSAGWKHHEQPASFAYILSTLVSMVSRHIAVSCISPKMASATDSLILFVFDIVEQTGTVCEP